MNANEFLDIVQETRLSSSNREAARLHFVEGKKQVEVCAEVGISKQRMNQIVQVVEKAIQKRLEEERADFNRHPLPGLTHVVALNASYAVAVKTAREQFGDDAEIRTPRDRENYVGEIVARTDFHLVQSQGRGTVIVHELAKLDRVPALGNNISIEYQNGRGAVAERHRSTDKSIGR